MTTAILLASLLAAVDCGGYRPTIDVQLQRRFEATLSEAPQPWMVKTLDSSSTPNSRLLELAREPVHVWVHLQYLPTTEDAGKHLQCRLSTIQVPRYRRVSTIGDEAYIVTEHGLLFRSGPIVFHITAMNGSLEIEENLAARLLAVGPVR
jgi:hypothetical protein